MKTTIILATALAIGSTGIYTYTQRDCRGLSDAYCSLADTLYAKHGTKATYEAVRDYKLKGARSSGDTASLFDVEFKDVVSFVKTAKGLL